MVACRLVRRNVSLGQHPGITGAASLGDTDSYTLSRETEKLWSRTALFPMPGAPLMGSYWAYVLTFLGFFLPYLQIWKIPSS